MQRVEVPQSRRRRHLGRDVSALEPVDLVERDHDRDAEREHLSRDEPIAGADPLTRGKHEKNPLDLFEGCVDRPLHVLGQRIERPLETR